MALTAIGGVPQWRWGSWLEQLPNKVNVDPKGDPILFRIQDFDDQKNVQNYNFKWDLAELVDEI